MTVLEKNEKALERFGGEFLHSYRARRSEVVRKSEIVEIAGQEKIICKQWNNRLWRLNSCREPEYAAQLYASRYTQMRDYAVVCIFGLSDGRAIRQLLKNCNKTQTILIYEPDREIFMTAMAQFPLEDIFRWHNLNLIVGGINEHKLEDRLYEMINYQNHTLITHCILPNYDILYPTEAKTYIDSMLYFSKIEVFNKNTEVELAAKFADNLLENLPYLLGESSVSRLLARFAREKIEDMPAIIVSAGPSLDKNIRELKKAEGKAFIIGVDSALKALVREGIHFDLAISVDPRKNPDVFADDRVYDYPYVLSGYSIPMLAENIRDRMFFQGGYGFDAFAEIISAKTGERLKTLETGGSVATDAFSLLVEMGFRNIILIGQDLAFTDGKGHVSGFMKDEKADKAHVESRVREPIEAYGGGTVLTDIQMNSYRQWFEQHIAQHRNRINVYNATEGGARIQGTIEITLREAIKQLCTREITFGEIIRSVPKLFNEEQRQELGKAFGESVHKIELLQGKLQEGAGAYDKLIQLEQRNQRASAEYKRTLEKIYEINQIEENDAYMSLVRLYAKASEYEVAEDIYVAEELSVEEIAERGKRMMEGYAKGCETCKKSLEQILIPKLRNF